MVSYVIFFPGRHPGVKRALALLPWWRLRDIETSWLTDEFDATHDANNYTADKRSSCVEYCQAICWVSVIITALQIFYFSTYLPKTPWRHRAYIGLIGLNVFIGYVLWHPRFYVLTVFSWPYTYGRAHAAGLCLSPCVVRLSVCRCGIVAKRCVIEQKLLLTASYRIEVVYEKSIGTKMNDRELWLLAFARWPNSRRMEFTYQCQTLRYIRRWISRNSETVRDRGLVPKDHQ